MYSRLILLCHAVIRQWWVYVCVKLHLAQAIIDMLIRYCWVCSAMNTYRVWFNVLVSWQHKGGVIDVAMCLLATCVIVYLFCMAHGSALGSKYSHLCYSRIYYHGLENGKEYPWDCLDNLSRSELSYWIFPPCEWKAKAKWGSLFPHRIDLLVAALLG